MRISGTEPSSVILSQTLTKLELINKIYHMRFSGTEPSSVILSQTK